MLRSSIGPYRILEKIGQGGMGEVFLADDPRLGRRVAVKTLAGSAMDVPDARSRLVREARAAARLNHPNIAAIYDIVETDSGTHVVMELVEGENLAARVQRGPLPPAEVTTIGIQLASALGAAHAQGIVHRDLKPANVQLTASGSVKVLDFGLARHEPLLTPLDEDTTGRDVALTRPGQIMGTPAYIAPELLRGVPADPRSDLYSIGVLLFELLTGKRPYDAPDFFSLAMKALSDSMPYARALNALVPEGLNQIVARAMERDPELRYQTAAELQSDLAQFAAHSGDLPTRSVMVVTTGALRAAAGRAAGPRRLVAAALAAVLLATLVGSFLWLSRRKSASEAASTGAKAPVGTPVVAVLSLANATGRAEDEALGIGFSDAITHRLARLSRLSVVGRQDVRQLASQQLAPLPAADALAARYIVTGSVNRSEGRLRVTLVVTRADGVVVWSHAEEGADAELFSLQSRVAEGIATSLGSALTPDERESVRRHPARDLEAYAQYAQGRALLDRRDEAGKLRRAVTALEEATRREPAFALAHAALGEAYFALHESTGDPQWLPLAKGAALESLRLDASLPEVRVTLARIYLGTGKPEAAAAELKAVIEMQPADHEARGLLGDAQAALGQPAEAADTLEQAVRLRPAFWRNHARLAFLQFRTGQFDEAVKTLEVATALQPDNVWGHQMRGAALQALGRDGEALQSYARANAIAPEAQTLSNMGTLLYHAGRHAEAATSYQAAIDLRPNSVLTHQNLGDVQQRLGNPPAAQAAYARALVIAAREHEVNPRNASILSRMGVLQAKRGNGPLSLKHIRQARQLAPADMEVLYDHAVILSLLGRVDESARELQQALASGYSIVEARRDDDLAPLRQHVHHAQLFQPRAASTGEGGSK